MKRTLALLFAGACATACTTVQEVKRPGGDSEFIIACGASTGWNMCYSKANETCPQGYKTLSENAGFNRKELRISCPKPS